MRYVQQDDCMDGYADGSVVARTASAPSEHSAPSALVAALLGCLMVAALALSLTPAPAFAATAVGASADLQAQSGSTVKVWVLKRAVMTERTAKYGDTTNTTAMNSFVKYGYNGNGQLVKQVTNGRSVVFGYKGARIATYRDKAMGGNGIETAGTLAYDKQKRLVKVEAKSTTGTTTRHLAYNDQGQVVNEKQVVTYSVPVPGVTIAKKYAYNEAGSLTKANSVYSNGMTAKERMKYGKKGNLTRYASARYTPNGYLATSSVYKYAFTSKKGRIAKRVDTLTVNSVDTASTITCTYKHVKVPKKYAPLVKRQQWALQNPDGGDFVLPVIVRP